MVASHLHYEARRTPSFLAGLIDRRARADGQVQRLTALLANIHSELDLALKHRDASDNLLRSYYAGLAAAEIQPISGWMGRFGKRGTITGEMRSFLCSAGAEGVTTSELAAYLAAALGLDHASPSAWKKWVHAVRVRLGELKARGEVEALHDAGKEPGKVGRWRLKTAANPSVASLLATAGAHGVEVVVTDEDLPP